MSFTDTTPKTNITSKKGSSGYIMALTLVATLGGLLFGYHTAGANGAEKQPP